MIFQRIINFFKGASVPAPPPKLTGTVKYFNRKRGFGFIESNQIQEDVFLHIKDAEGKVRQGSKVSFSLDQNEKGYIAREVVSVQNWSFGFSILRICEQHGLVEAKI